MRAASWEITFQPLMQNLSLLSPFLATGIAVLTVVWLVIRERPDPRDPSASPERAGPLIPTSRLLPWWARGFRIRSKESTLTVLAPRQRRRPRRAIRIGRRHEAYLWDMLIDFEYWHGAVEPEMVEGLALADYSNPKVHRLRPSGDDFRFIGLPEHEGRTKLFLDAAQLRPGELVVDLGAYCGATCVAFARAVGSTGHVVTFDPDPAAAAVCRENVARHVPGMVTVVEAAVWSKAGTIPFVAEGNIGSAAAAVLPRGGATREVLAVSLGDAFAQACQISGLARVAFLKINVEGSEVPILEGGIDALRTHRPRLVVEPHLVEEGKLNTETVMSLLAMAGYRGKLGHQASYTHPHIVGEPIGAGFDRQVP